MNQVYFGDCREVMRELIDQSVQVQTCVTSPPYYGLRDYGVDGQIGLEASIEEYIDTMVDVFRLVRDLLADDGTLWLNIGDSYAGSWGAQSRGNTAGEASSTLQGSSMLEARQMGAYPLGKTGTGSLKKFHGLKPKDMCLVPYRLVLALQADGWWVRRDIIWHKPNPMPESAKDRPTTAHEYIYLLTKSARYYYDSESIAEPLAETSIGRLNQDVENQQGSTRANGGAKTNGPMKAVGGKGNSKTFRGGGAYTSGQSFNNNSNTERNSHGNKPNETGTRSKCSVWTVATKGYSGAHFATFPPKLIEPCILAGAPVGGIVLDPFFGSGTTGEVAEQHGRKWIGIELNKEYEVLQKERTQQTSLEI